MTWRDPSVCRKTGSVLAWSAVVVLRPLRVGLAKVGVNLVFRVCVVNENAQMRDGQVSRRAEI